MTLLNRSTRRRLQSLRQVPCVWEGDRYSMEGEHSTGGSSVSDCILWVDGSAGTVRSMEMVSAEVGQEAVVRVLLRAMEHPNGPMEPMRPKEILVRDRELQFFLRGILQDLDIAVNYAPALPLIDEIFQGLQQFLAGNNPRLPAQYADALEDAALTIWDDAPWERLDEEKIIQISIEGQDVESLYLSFLGMLGVEFGVLMYRSKESLKAFRQTVLEVDESSPELLEEAFLQQDCLFLTFEQTDPDLEQQAPRKSRSKKLVPLSAPVVPEFGNLHPLEGMRPHLYEEEALTVLASLQALHQFIQEHQQDWNPNHFPACKAHYSIDVSASNSSESSPQSNDSPLSVTVSTLPEFAAELASMVDEAPEQNFDDDALSALALPMIDGESVPEGTISQVGRIPWTTLTDLRLSARAHQAAEDGFPSTADGFPIILLQTSRPKAHKLIDVIQDAGGLKSIGFLPGEDSWGERTYDLGVLQTQDNVFHIFTEYDGADPIHRRAKEKWHERCRQTNGYCGLIIAKGVTGAAKGNPSLKDMVGLFEVRSLTTDNNGLGMLRLLPNLSLD